MYELRTIFPSLPGKYSRANRGKNHKCVRRLLPHKFLKYLNHMPNTSVKDALNFIKILISSMKKSYLKITNELLSTKLCNSPLISYFLHIIIKP